MSTRCQPVAGGAAPRQSASRGSGGASAARRPARRAGPRQRPCGRVERRSARCDGTRDEDAERQPDEHRDPACRPSGSGPARSGRARRPGAAAAPSRPVPRGSTPCGQRAGQAWSSANPSQDRALLRRDPPRPVGREVERDAHRGRPRGEHVAVVHLVPHREPRAADLVDPQLQAQRLGVIDDRPEVVDLVPRDHRAVGESLVPEEEHRDARLFEVGEVGRVVDVPVGVHVRPAHVHLVHEPAHGVIVAGGWSGQFAAKPSSAATIASPRPGPLVWPAPLDHLEPGLRPQLRHPPRDVERAGEVEAAVDHHARDAAQRSRVALQFAVGEEAAAAEVVRADSGERELRAEVVVAEPGWMVGVERQYGVLPGAPLDRCPLAGRLARAPAGACRMPSPVRCRSRSAGRRRARGSAPTRPGRTGPILRTASRSRRASCS